MISSPTLTVIAGCNGSGKSSFSNAVTSKQSPSFDYDKIFLQKYNSLHDSEFRDIMAHNLAREALEQAINTSINHKSDFTYETNFNSTPLYWPEKFKSAGFNLRLIYFCLNTIDEAKKRVQIRVENGGHFVPDSEITNRYRLGYNNLNEHWRFFNEIYLFDTSAYKQKPRFLLSIVNNELLEKIDFPKFLIPLVPNIQLLK